MNILPKLFPYITVFFILLVLGYIFLIVVPIMQSDYNSLTTIHTNIVAANTISVTAPVWVAHVRYDVGCTSVDAFENMTCPPKYQVTINEGDATRKIFGGITKEKMISILTYYHVNYNLDLIEISPYYRPFVYTYQDYINIMWGNQEPTMKYNASEFAPEHTPVPAPAPTFSASKWYNETIV